MLETIRQAKHNYHCLSNSSQVKPKMEIKKLARFFKRKLANFLRTLPISSEVLGPPKGFYKTTWNWLYNSKIGNNKNQGSVVSIYPKHKFSRCPPKTIEDQVDWQFEIEYQHESPETFFAVIPEGRVWGNNGTVIAPDDKFLADLSIEFGSSESEHSILRQWRLPYVHYINGTVAVLSAVGGDKYFHWMFDVLPRIHLLKCAGVDKDCVDKFCVNGLDYPFQRETLAVLGIPEEKIIESCKFPHIKAKKLVVPSLPGNTGHMPNWACEFLKKEFLRSNIPVSKLGKREFIYISRANANYRRVLNEPDVVKFLQKFGFRVVALELISVAEQALLLSSASVVVAPHGAGLSNLVFCQPGTKVVELFSPNYVNVCFWACSDQVGLDYYYLIGHGQRPDEYIDPHAVREDILVNINSLAELMKCAGIISF